AEEVADGDDNDGLTRVSGLAEQPAQGLEPRRVQFDRQFAEGLLLGLEEGLRIGVASERPRPLGEVFGDDMAEDQSLAFGGLEIAQALTAVLVLAGQFGQRHGLKEDAHLLAESLV